MKTLFTLLLLSVFSFNVMAQDKDLSSMMKERNEFYFSFEINDLQSLEKISDIISIDKLEGNNVIAYANNQQYEKFLTLGIVLLGLAVAI